MHLQVKIPNGGNVKLKLRGVAEPQTAVFIQNQHRLNRAYTRITKFN